ncbi:RdRP-domain-containing protein [Gloeophyllum trabeum ATCC 11539]|uniref:RNA-dependent RNA polymerase n=1 Tax=Gloeophyllum trabeum (strain ATCC 11539 / FP-39264 / Madison 617) TaxID=670483 RepID=S7RT73_GLOTA|nr:RdRP-domain-containing protein [Gloeophyllum trabeum ATCC 11539]EPQ57890.1 RdRP-domain-containing protein [Gloeophyllum trabeum ATCC 11539]
MEIDLKGVAHIATKYEVKRAIAQVLHGDDFRRREIPRLWNFDVSLNPGLTETRNDGSGKLILPDHKLGRKFLEWARQDGNNIRVHGRKIRFFRSDRKPRAGELQMLRKAPYLDPAKDEERDRILQALDCDLRVNKVNFGIYYYDTSRPGAPKSFSNEWEGDYKSRSYAVMRVAYDHKVMRIKLGDPMTEETCHRIVIKFSSIRKIGFGYDAGSPYICFDLMIPPILEREPFNRLLTGDDFRDHKNFRYRIGFLDPAHERISPYAHQIRVVLCQDRDLEMFRELCQAAGLRPPIPAQVEASRREFYGVKQLNRIYTWLRDMEWTVAFQIEALLHNGLVNSYELLHDLHQPISLLYKQQGAATAHHLRQFSEALQTRGSRETAMQCFQRINPVPAFPPAPGQFMCHHVSFTPTRIILEGPYTVQSNRVIRHYEGFEEYFIRVDFRDEDRLQYRWDREVKAEFFLKERVGEVLKNGFTLASRHFEFLAYSQSALRDHSVWFMHPFHHPQEGYVTAEAIRQTLGDFTGVIRCPSKYAARMAQAFTATDPAVKIFRHEWEEIPDLGNTPYEFTDGVGTVSRQLADEIWDKLCADRKIFEPTGPKPTAFQIRFLGYKGMVALDDQLEGRKMRLRPSMNKFRVHEEDCAEIEIARAFECPSIAYLNKSLIMVLEDRGVQKDSFLKLQERAVADVMTAGDSIARLRDLLEGNGLGRAHRLSNVLQGLFDLGFELNSQTPDRKKIENPFLKRIVNYSRHHILRDLKHGARIPIPDSWCLPGVADEGPAYVASGHQNVFCLKPGTIYACIQNRGDEEPTWIKGNCIIWRSPVVHPGDVMRVYAVGKPPEDQLCLFRNLVNVVVMPSQGDRSMASQLGGGDVDGDLFCVSKDPTLLPVLHVLPAAYAPVAPMTIEEDSRIEDVCDFVVEYIHSDVLGLLSDRHLIIADQSKEGTQDERCLQLAELCSRAVDYPKSGVPVNIDKSPRLLIPYKPDWHAAEVTAPRNTDYYESDRAVGHLYRAIPLHEPAKVSPDALTPRPETVDPITTALTPLIQHHLKTYKAPDFTSQVINQSYRRYRDELRYIRITHTLSNDPEVRLTEEEVVVSTILAKCSQKRWRKDRIHRMKVHASTLVQEIQREWLKPEERNSSDGLRLGLYLAWQAWKYTINNAGRVDNDAMNSFGLIALGVIFEVLDKLDPEWRVNRGKVPTLSRKTGWMVDEDQEFAPPAGKPKKGNQKGSKTIRLKGPNKARKE